MLELEKYAGKSSRFTCPSCGAKKSFARYIDIEKDEYLAPEVGRCNRDSKCGYHLKPKEYFAAHPAAEKPEAQTKIKPTRAHNAPIAEAVREPNFIELGILQRTLSNSENNPFINFLLNLLPDEAEKVIEVIKKYFVGTTRDGKTVFWQIDGRKRIRTGKIIAYDTRTGKRNKDSAPNWIHAELKKKKLLPEDFNLSQCFFGEHLTAAGDLPLAVVEAEKTAILGAIFFPHFTWVACGAKLNLKPEKLKRFEGRKIVLYPDADAFERWQQTAAEARTIGLNVKVSTIIESRATAEQKANGCDLADFLIEEAKRNGAEDEQSETPEIVAAEKAIDLPVSPTLQQIINGFINRRIFFEVKTTEFILLDHNGELTEDDKAFFDRNRDGILCHLQQMLLCKQIFDDSLHLFEQFKCNVETHTAASANDVQSEQQILINTVKDYFARFIDTETEKLAA